MKASEIQLDETLPHGTREGYDLGCKGAHCPGVERVGMSCRQASIRYASDLSYKRRIDGGLSPEAIAAEDALDEVPPPKLDERPSTHNTVPTTSFEDSQTPLADFTEQSDEVAPEPEVDGILLERHGTRFGYQDGCRLKELCPGIERTGVSCTQAVSAYQREMKARKHGEAVRPVDASEVPDEEQAAEPEIVSDAVTSPWDEPISADASTEDVQEELPGVVTGTRVRAEDLLTELADTKAELEAVRFVRDERDRELGSAFATIAGLKRELNEVTERLVQAARELDVEKAKARDRDVAESRSAELHLVTPPERQSVSLSLQFADGRLEGVVVTAGA